VVSQEINNARAVTKCIFFLSFNVDEMDSCGLGVIMLVDASQAATKGVYSINKMLFRIRNH